MNRENLIYKSNKYVYNFQQFETIKSFAKNILACKIALDDDKYQSNLLHEIVDFKKNTKPRTALYEDREMVPNPFKSKIFPLKPALSSVNLGQIT